jgi:hypothetical protein
MIDISPHVPTIARDILRKHVGHAVPPGRYVGAADDREAAMLCSQCFVAQTVDLRRRFQDGDRLQEVIRRHLAGCGGTVGSARFLRDQLRRRPA